MIVCWSVKGGSGTTVVAAMLALTLASRTPTRLVDLAGDLPATLGVAEPSGPGVLDWLADRDATPDVLPDLEVTINDDLTLLARGGSPEAPTADRLALLAAATSDRLCIVDAGSGAAHVSEVRALARRSILVLRPCYLALRRAAALAERPDAIVLLVEDGRALGARDVEAVVGAPVAASLPVQPSIARLVDAGLLAGRVPSAMAAPLAAVA